MPMRRLVARTPMAALEPAFRAIRAREGVAEVYPPDAVADAERARDAVTEPAHIEGDRADRTDVEFVTVDPVGSRDLDQALHVEATGAGWTVRYAIADVAAHVVPASALDRESHERAETVYCPDTRVGLHPSIMSEGFASLLPGQRTRAVVWTIAVDAAGELGEARVERAWVASRAQYSYAELEAAGTPDAARLVADLRSLGDARRGALRRLGAVTLPKPSQEVVADGTGLRLEFRAARGVEDDNAQVSLLTGSAAARMMLDAGVGVLRTMPPASDEALHRLARQAHGLGIAWEEGEAYADVLARLDLASPRAAAFLTAAVHLFRGAAWVPFDVAGGLPEPEQTRHGALGGPYAHVTAPLRRLVDRYGTEVCLAHCAGREVPRWVRDAMPTLGAEMEAGVRRGSRVDRACLEAVEAAVLAPHVGEAFEGVGLDEDTVQLADPAVVARCSGGVAVGKRQRVRLISATMEAGARFAVDKEEP